MLNGRLKQEFLKELERVAKADQSITERNGEPLLLSILYILKQFDGTRNAKFMIEMRKHYCLPVVILEEKIILDDKFPELSEEMAVIAEK